MVTYSKSTSKNFDRALFLSKQADEFNVITHSNQDIYQATFKPENHLNFIQLYELIKGWKSTFVFQNGKLIDRKVLGQINYCYGDKLRSHDSDFCYGASMFTENPFGCHRLMIHFGQKPWYEWKQGETEDFIFIDKEAMKSQIDSKSKTFKHCPAFNYNSIIDVLNKLPNRIDKNSQLYKDLYTPSFRNNVTISIKPDKKPSKIKRIKANKKPSGCGATVLLFVSALSIGLFTLISLI